MSRALVLLLLFPALAFGQTISGTSSSTIASGQTLTISGSGFGTKSQAAPIYWTTFDDGTAGERIDSYDSGWTQRPEAGAWSYLSVAGARRGGLGLENLGSKSGFNEASYHFPASAEIYVNYWFWVDSGGSVRVLKMPRLTSSTAAGGGGEYNGAGNTQMDGKYVTASGGSADINYNDGCTNDLDADGGNAGPGWITIPRGRWFNVQFFRRNSSPPGSSNGTVIASLDDNYRHLSDTMVTRCSSWSGLHDTVWFNLGGSDVVNTDIYADDVYIDNTQARVEIGNASSYWSATHREIQIPSSWGDGSVVVTCNTGTFSNADNVWIFVVDSDGNISSGYGPLTVDSDFVLPDAPSAPTLQSATAGTNQVALSWSASTGASGYYVMRSTTSGGPYSQVGSTASTSFTNTGLTGGTTYHYVIRAYNAGGTSANSNELSATPSGVVADGLKYPINLEATAIGE